MKGRALIVGRGSIGMRHAVILADLGLTPSFVSRRGGADAFPALEDAFRGGRRWDIVVICSPTAAHGADLDRIASLGHDGVALVEKPLFEIPRALPAHSFSRLAVAYPLRFHPALRALRAEMGTARAISANVYAGQWLPDWRPDRDYRDTYSARAADGGGVLRDLSHELDLADWLFGPWSTVTAQGGHLSALEIDSDDVFQLLASHERCAALAMEVNYLDRRTRRRILVHLETGVTVEADLIGATLTVDREAIRIYPVERNAMMTAMLRAALYGEGAEDLCDAAAGLRVLRQIEAAERAASSGVRNGKA